MAELDWVRHTGRVLKRLAWFYRFYRLHLGVGRRAALKSAWLLAR